MTEKPLKIKNKIKKGNGGGRREEGGGKGPSLMFIKSTKFRNFHHSQLGKHIVSYIKKCYFNKRSVKHLVCVNNGYNELP